MFELKKKESNPTAPPTIEISKTAHYLVHISNIATIMRKNFLINLIANWTRLTSFQTKIARNAIFNSNIKSKSVQCAINVRSIEN